MNFLPTILLATSNYGKVAAFRRLLADTPVTVVTPRDLLLEIEVEEDASTFAENSLAKARAYYDVTGLNVLADDSGICVDALGGEPGVHSARFGGLLHSPTAQNLLLLERLDGIHKEDRGASFVCAVSLASSDGELWSVERAVRGSVACELRGTHGFGYDPIFIPDSTARTYAEMKPEEKDLISHRSLALADAISHMRRDLGLIK